MKKQDNKDSAFPIDLRLESRADKVLVYGMSLRDYFAAALLQGNLNEFNHSNDPAKVAAKVYRYADAMLAERYRREAQP